ncbi:MAG TPA: hypothetical protein VJ123_04660 [Anaerolineales bacterium]|nr:hypothetical protein [Anaerolineales bacterium]
MKQEEMPIFTSTFDFLSWLLPAANHFPRAQRHTFTRRQFIERVDNPFEDPGKIALRAASRPQGVLREAERGAPQPFATHP